MTYNNGYTCNPAYIVDEIVRRDLPVEIVFVGPTRGRMIGEEIIPTSANIKVVRRGTAEMFKEQGSSKIWIDNALNCLWCDVPKRDKQIYINTRHGSMGIKRLNGNKRWLKIASRCNKTTDFCITNSMFEEEVFRSSFWPDVPFLRLGHPRNDVLFNGNMCEAVNRKVRKYYGIGTEKKILLYAPTFRDNGNIHCFNIDYLSLKCALQNKFGNDWVILLRFHFKNRNIVHKLDESDWHNKCYGVCRYAGATYCG